MFILIEFDSILTRSSPVFSPGFLLFSPDELITGCDSSLGSFCYSPVYFLSRMHLHSGYRYYFIPSNFLLNRLRFIAV